MSEGFSDFLSTVFEDRKDLPDLPWDIVLRIGNDCVSTTCVKTMINQRGVIGLKRDNSATKRPNGPWVWLDFPFVDFMLF